MRFRPFGREIGPKGEEALRRVELWPALERLAEMVTERIHHERADTRFVRSTKTARYKLHQAKIPRYLSLTLEVGMLLREFAGEMLERNLKNLSEQLPVWHHAFGERPNMSHPEFPG